MMENKPTSMLFTKLSFIISIIALVFSVVSFWRIDSVRFSSSNVQILQSLITDGDLNSNKEFFTVAGSILLENQGNATANIRDIYWQTSDKNVPDEIKSNSIFIISDKENLSVELNVTKYSNYGIVGLNKLTIDPGEKKTIYFYLHTQKLDTKGQFVMDNQLLDDIYYPYIVITFQNGQQIIATPILK